MRSAALSLLRAKKACADVSAAAGAAKDRAASADAMMVFMMVTPVCAPCGVNVCPAVLPFDETNMPPAIVDLNALLLTL
jgi:hypothetical protein